MTPSGQIEEGQIEYFLKKHTYIHIYITGPTRCRDNFILWFLLPLIHRFVFRDESCHVLMYTYAHTGFIPYTFEALHKWRSDMEQLYIRSLNWAFLSPPLSLSLCVREQDPRHTRCQPYMHDGHYYHTEIVMQRAKVREREREGGQGDSGRPCMYAITLTHTHTGSHSDTERDQSRGTRSHFHV